MCQAAILHWWFPNRQQAIYANSLLNYGNQQFEAYAPVHTSAASPGSNTVSASASADAFWLAPPIFNTLLAFNYPAAALPDGFEVGTHRPTRHRADTLKRQQPEGGSLSHHPTKKAKAASGRQTKRQHSSSTGAKGRIQLPELSSKLQKRLATLLELVTAGAEEGGKPGIKQVHHLRLISLLAYRHLHHTHLRTCAWHACGVLAFRTACLWTLHLHVKSCLAHSALK